LEEYLDEIRNVIVGNGHLQDISVFRPVDAVNCQNDIACDEEAVDDEVDWKEIVFKHFVNRKSASQNPKKTVDPDRLRHLSLVLSSKDY
jgi:hypothetical protein